MSLLSDEILNKYIDGELDGKTLKEVQDILTTSETERKRFNALKLLHSELSVLQEDKVRNDFTSFVMAKINKKVAAPKEQKYFIFSISSFIVLLCLGIVGYAAYEIFSSYSAPVETVQVTKTAQHLGNGLITELTKIFSSKNLSIIGSVFSLGILITGYFFFERQRQAKANLGA
jgi:anti-sigma factor RsiW